MTGHMTRSHDTGRCSLDLDTLDVIRIEAKSLKGRARVAIDEKQIWLIRIDEKDGSRDRAVILANCSEGR